MLKRCMRMRCRADLLMLTEELDSYEDLRAQLMCSTPDYQH